MTLLKSIKGLRSQGEVLSPKLERDWKIAILKYAYNILHFLISLVLKRMYFNLENEFIVLASSRWLEARKFAHQGQNSCACGHFLPCIPVAARGPTTSTAMTPPHPVLSGQTPVLLGGLRSRWLGVAYTQGGAETTAESTGSVTNEEKPKPLLAAAQTVNWHPHNHLVKTQCLHNV